jgi:hypothetical protein
LLEEARYLEMSLVFKSKDEREREKVEERLKVAEELREKEKRDLEERKQVP